jgi:hypothetical protein
MATASQHGGSLATSAPLRYLASMFQAEVLDAVRLRMRGTTHK